LVAAKGVLYGTTSGGGKNGKGTVFSVTTSGKETVLHSFAGSDGEFPAARLTYASGTLYGTTDYGGPKGCEYGCGTVFSVTTEGSEHVLYSFKGAPDGELPDGGVINAGNTLYGTTQEGGKYEAGTAFSLTL
jgi:uncharacterized repeat protein (TIGR03803 family)